MKFASTIPFKAALAAVSITTIGMLAIAMFDTAETVRVLPPDDPTTTCSYPPIEEPPPPPANPPDEVAYPQPGATVSL